VDANAASYDSASQTMKNAKFFYIYILQSKLHAVRFYTGLTDDLRKRIRNHNAGRVHHTAKGRPWRLKAYVAISERVRAAEFEHYLKSASGRAFARKRL
jgi:putative endonuclease